MKIFTFFLIALFGLGLNGCGTPSVEDIASDNELSKKTGQECNEMPKSKRQESQLCRNLDLSYQMKNGIKKEAGNMFRYAVSGMSKDAVLKVFEKAEYGPWKISGKVPGKNQSTLTDGRLGLCWYQNIGGGYYDHIRQCSW